MRGRISSRVYQDAAAAALFLVLATAVGALFARAGFPETNVVLVYLAAVLLTARYTHGVAYGLAVSMAAIFAYNFFFTEPRYTLQVNDTSYIITFAIMMFTSIFTSALTSRMKANARRATERERDTQVLYQLTNRLSDAQSPEAIGEVALEAVRQTFGREAEFLFFDEHGEQEPEFLKYSDGGVTRCAPRGDAAQGGESACGGIERGAYVEWPVCSRQRVLAALRLRRDDAPLDAARLPLLRSMLESVAMAMERLRAAQAQQKYREESRQERYRSNLLRAISHDLRTPLSGIMGTSEMIRDMSAPDDPRGKLAGEIWSDADWLRALVENILSLTRLEDGSLHIQKQPEAVEEIVGSAIAQMERRAPEYEIEAALPEALLMAPMDARLIVQMLINLLDNAVKHTPPGGEIRVEVAVEGDQAVFRVLDRGAGIREEDLPHLFERFYTSSVRRADAQRGIGLGLAICDAIARAHGGAISASNRPGGGAAFVFTLPLKEDGHGQST